MSPDDQLRVLRFTASFLWADLDVDVRERAFFVDLARELGVPRDRAASILELLERPPVPEDVDPTCVPPALAPLVRDAVLRAIASDGRVMPAEIAMFDLLDELLPASG